MLFQWNADKFIKSKINIFWG